MNKSDLRIDWATYKAAKYACENWHYSKCMPCSKTIKVGVWEENKFIGVVIYSRGTNKTLGVRYDLNQTTCAELTRVAISQHKTAISRIISLSLMFLRRSSNGLRLIVSFSDMQHGHYGGIYQAGNWIYCGVSESIKDKRTRSYEKDGVVYSWCTVAGVLVKKRYHATLNGAIKAGFKPLKQHPKHKYLMPLDADMRKQALPLSKPYPKRPKKHEPGDQPESGRGSTDPGAPVPGDECQPVAHARQ